MAIETLDDIVEELADQLGIYGSHAPAQPGDKCDCRVCFVSALTPRIRQAVEVEQKLAK